MSRRSGETQRQKRSQTYFMNIDQQTFPAKSNIWILERVMVFPGGQQKPESQLRSSPAGQKCWGWPHLAAALEELPQQTQPLQKDGGSLRQEDANRDLTGKWSSSSVPTWCGWQAGGSAPDAGSFGSGSGQERARFDSLLIQQAWSMEERRMYFRRY